MIQGFDNETKPLTDYEMTRLMPIIIQGLQAKRGIERSVTNKQMCDGLRRYGYQVSEPRIRKIINHIRCHGLVIGLVSTSKGYYIATSRDELDTYIQSLIGREGAIHEVRMNLEKQRDTFYGKGSY
jgi:hypothetical protein